MRHTRLCLILLLVASPGQVPSNGARRAAAAPVPLGAKDTPASELAKLEGTWEITACDFAGRESSGHVGMRITVTKDEFAWGNAAVAGKVARIDPAKSPREIDYQFTEGPDAGKTAKGIYKLAGDTLTECCPPPGADARPTEFKSTAENGCYLLTFKRVKKTD